MLSILDEFRKILDDLMVLSIHNSILLYGYESYTGRFIKVVLDKSLIPWIRPKDILYISVRQSPFFSWELVDVFKYYPSIVMDYVKKEAVR